MTTVDLARSECPVIRKQGDRVALKKAYASLRRVLKTMPVIQQDPTVGLRRTRSRRGLV